MVCKKYEIRRGRLLYRDELEFKSTFHELVWKEDKRVRCERIKMSLKRFIY